MKKRRKKVYVTISFKFPQDSLKVHFAKVVGGRELKLSQNIKSNYFFLVFKFYHVIVVLEVEIKGIFVKWFSYT